jgi:membrane associated rhomboid family serine protease
LRLLDKLEKRLGRIGVKGLMNYIIGLNVIVFILTYLDTTGMFLNKLLLAPQMVMQGEVWRLITFVFIPPTFSPLWLIFALYLYYMIGSSLEHEWGTFKFNAYYLIGIIATIIGAFLTGSAATSAYLNLSLFLAFACIFPNYQLMLFFVLPVKIKYLAWLDAAFLGYTLLTGSLSVRAMVIASILNFLLFFGKDLYLMIRSGGRAYYNKSAYKAKLPKDITIHRCEVCGRTEKDDKSLEFRYCVECEGDHEYCMEHLDSHEHIKTT